MRKLFGGGGSSGGGKTKRPSESKDEGERESKRANTEEPRTAWALVLEQAPELGQGVYKLVVEMDEYECSVRVSQLEESVRGRLEGMGYNFPPRMDTYAENPFVQSFDEINGGGFVPQLSGNIRREQKFNPIDDDHRGPHTPYYVLTSKLKERVQVPMDISTSQLSQQMVEPSAPPAQASGPSPQRRIELIFRESLGRYRVRVRTLEGIERFRIDLNDRFAHTVNSLDIPIYPPSLPELKPHLLMDGLVDPENLTNFVTPEQHAKFATLLAQGAFAIMAVSGAGKTRTVLEYLAKNWGLLFVVDTGYNGGIRDFAVLSAFLSKNLKRGEEHRQTNDDIAQRAFQCILLARLLLLDYLLQLFPLESLEPLTPLQWLWIQLYPDYMLEVPDNTTIKISELIMSVGKRLLRSDIPSAVIFEAVQIGTTVIMQHLKSDPSNTLPCFIDEAQLLLKDSGFDGFFPSKNSDAGGRALFSVVLRACDTLVRGPVLSGTGMKMSAAMDALSSHVVPKQGDKGRLYSNLPLLKDGDCWNFIDRYLSLSTFPAEEQATIIRVVSGRPRLSAAFVTSVLTSPNDANLIELLRAYVVDVTGDGPKTTEKGSFFGALQRFKRSEALPDGQIQAALNEFKDLALRYAITGRPQLMRQSEGAVQLIEDGLCPLHREGKFMRATVEEPMVVIAACNFFNLMSYQWSMLSGANASSAGFEFERSLMLAIEGGMDTIFSTQTGTHQALEAHPLITTAGVELPPQFCGQWSLEKRHGAYGGFPIGATYAKDSVTLDAWMENPTSTFYFPDNNTGPDLVFFATSSSGQRAIVFIQTKLIIDLLQGDDLKHAVATTDIAHVLRNRKGKVYGTRTAERDRVLELFQQLGLVNIGILITYTAGSAAVTELKRDDHLFIAASGSPRFEQMFTAEFAEDIRSVKEH